MQLREGINIVIRLIEENDAGISENDLLNEITKIVDNKMIAEELLTFIPIVMCRIIMPNFHFPKSYIEHDKENNIRKEVKFSENIVYIDIERHLKKILDGGLSQDSILKVTGRSPEFHVINDFLLKGVDMENIGLGLINIDRSR